MYRYQMSTLHFPVLGPSVAVMVVRKEGESLDFRAIGRSTNKEPKEEGLRTNGRILLLYHVYTTLTSYYELVN